MTTDEMRLQKGAVLVDFQETQEKLAHLRHRASTLGELLSSFGKWVSGSPEISIFRADQAHYGFNVHLTDAKYVSALEPMQYFKLADEIRETCEKLAQLAATKERLGLK
jgi:hypothetical protein